MMSIESAVLCWRIIVPAPSTKCSEMGERSRLSGRER